MDLSGMSLKSKNVDIFTHSTLGNILIEASNKTITNNFVLNAMK